MEPKNLRHWRFRQEITGRIYTCARPGRSLGKDTPTISDVVIRKWVNGLPGVGKVTLVSLLGRKNSTVGLREFSFYSFTGGFDSTSERGSKPSFQEWLNKNFPSCQFEVCEHPTYDGVTVPTPTLVAAAADILAALQRERTVVIVDSGGIQRTGALCKYMGLVEDFS